MSRPSLRRTPMLESLELRQVLSSVAVGPTPDQEYALELINLVRTNPSEAGQMLTSNLSPDVQVTLQHYGLTASGLQSKLDSATAQPPVAWSSALASSARSQSQFEASNAVQTHTGQGGSSLAQRISAAGYSNTTSIGENTYAYAESIEEAMQSFLFDWGVSDDGHYNNLLQPGVSAEDSYKDVGIGLVNTSGNGAGPLVITQDFGAQQNEGPQIIGAVFTDPNNTGFYSPGNGLGGVTISAVNTSTGATFTTQTMSAGGYQLPVPGNSYYKVTATQNGQVISSQQLYVGDVNVENDVIDNPSANPPPPSTPAQPSMPTPSPSPTISMAMTVANLATSSSNSSNSSNSQAKAVQATTPPAQNPPTTSTQSAPSWLSNWSRWTAGNQAN